MPNANHLKKIPLMGIGTFIGIELDEIKNKEQRMETVKKTVYNALRIGYRHIDLAENYKNLPAVGQALSQAMLPIEKDGLGINRSDLWITMKSNHYTREAIESYIEVLNVGYLDTFMLHHVRYFFGSEAQVKSIWSELTALPAELVKTFGVSNALEGHLIRLVAICEKYNLTKPFSNEIESNFWCSNDATIRYCKAQGIQVIAYSPLGYNVAPLMLGSEDVAKVAESMDATPAQIALAWNMSRGVAVIPKTTRMDRLEENFRATQCAFLIEGAHDKAFAKIKTQDGDGTLTNEDAQKHAEALTWHVILTPMVMALLREQERLNKKVASMNIVSGSLVNLSCQAKAEAVNHAIEALGELTDEKIIDAINVHVPDHTLYQALNMHSSYCFKFSIDNACTSISYQAKALLNLKAAIAEQAVSERENLEEDALIELVKKVR